MKQATYLKALGALIVGALLLAGCGGGQQPLAPQAPTELRARALHDGAALLTWQLGSTEHDNVLVYRSGGPGAVEAGAEGLVAVLPKGAVEYLDPETEVGAVSHYRIGVERSGEEPVIGDARVRLEPLPELSADPYLWPDALSATAPSEVRRGNGLTTTAGGVPTLNPLRSVGNVYLLDLLDGQGATLVRRGANRDWEPYAASGLTITNSGAGGTIAVQLREGIRWSDGAPVTAVDYVLRYVLETDADVNASAGSSWSGVRVEANGTHGLTYTFEQLTRNSLYSLAMAPLPDHVFGELYRSGGATAVREAWAADTDPAELVTTGPWSLFDSLDDRYVLVRNPYFGAWNHDSAGHRLPHVDTLTLRKTNLGAVESFLAELTDWAQLSELEAQAIVAGASDYQTRQQGAPIASSQFITFNHNLASDSTLQSLFRDARFRIAMSHLVDHERIIDLVYQGWAVPQWTSVYLTLPAWIDDTAPRYAYDPDEAQRILVEELGFSEGADGWLVDGSGRRLAFRLTTNEGVAVRAGIADVFQASAHSIGIDVEVETRPFGELVTEINRQGPERDLHGLLLGVTGGSLDWPFPASYASCLTGSPMWNASGSCLAPWEEELANLIGEGLSELDDDAARAIGRQIQQLEAAHQPMIYTVNPLQSYYWRPHVRGEVPEERVASAGTHRYLVLSWVEDR